MKLANASIMTLFLCVLFTPLCFAQSAKPALTLATYYAATCQDYTGTWQGFVTDPTDLFADGGPWPITIQLYNNGDLIIGNVSNIKYASNGDGIDARPVWAHCKNGVLSNIFWGKKGACGSYSQQGSLVSKNTLVLGLNYENSMTGTTFLAFLSRKNPTYSGTIPKTDAGFKLGKFESCH